MALIAGTKLGPYEIQSPLGAGGMGEVYRARDTRLDRTVAIKIVPTHLSYSPESKRRFEREARAISPLNHPHIRQLHPGGWRCPERDVCQWYAQCEAERDTVRRPLHRGQPQASSSVGRKLHRSDGRLGQRIVYEPHSGVHADHQRKRRPSDKAIGGGDRNGALLRNIAPTLYRAPENPARLTGWRGELIVRETRFWSAKRSGCTVPQLPRIPMTDERQ
jgi:serine/threonine protein kinase